MPIIKPKFAPRETRDCVCLEVFRTTGQLMPGHDDCNGKFPIEVPELDIPNAVGHTLLHLLGIRIPPEKAMIAALCGAAGLEMTAADTLEAVCHARKVPLDSFMSVVKDNPELSQETLQQAIDKLADVANYALERDTTVVWVR